MVETINVGQIRSHKSNYYRVASVNNAGVKCQTRTGPVGRFSVSTTAFKKNTFKKFKLVKDPLLPSNGGTLDPDHPNLSLDEQVKAATETEQIKILKKQNNKLKKQLLSKASGHQFIIEAVQECLTPLPKITIPKIPKPSRNSGQEEIAVLHISDTQIGKITDTYDSAVAEERLLQLVLKTIKITEMRRSAATINEIRVYLGGDTVEGEEIFSHQAHVIDNSVYRQAVHVAPMILGKCILILLEHFPKVKVVAVPGNHGRNGPRGARSHPETNWDSVCYATLQHILLGPEWNPRKELQGRLEMDYQDHWYAVDQVFSWSNLIVHGDQIKGGFAGFPFYGMGKKVWGWIDSIPESFSYVYTGHFHQFGVLTLNHRIVLANGTTESDNEFAQANLAAAGDPCQRLAFYNEEYGLISDNQVWLIERTPCK